MRKFVLIGVHVTKEIMFHFASEMMCNEHVCVHVRLVTQTLQVHQMYVFSYSILYPKVLGLKGIIKISTAPHKPVRACSQKWKHTVERDVIQMKR